MFLLPPVSTRMDTLFPYPTRCRFPSRPFLAQCAGMALEDACILARALDEFGTIEEALDRYQAARIPRTTRAVNGAADNAKRFHNPVLAHKEIGRAHV